MEAKYIAWPLLLIGRSGAKTEIPVEHHKLDWGYKICAKKLLLFSMLITHSWLAQAAGPVPGQLTIRVFSLVEVPPPVLASAITEAATLLRSVHIRLTWIDCSSPRHPASCASSGSANDLTIRILPAALPQTSKSAVGLAMRSEYGDSAVLFYDRALALRKPQLFLPQILGRVMAHEIAHMLLPADSHSDLGLMRAQWSQEDLSIGNRACFGLSASAVKLMQQAVLDRALVTNARAVP